MCGILGVINLKNNQEFDKNLFIEMNQTMNHRGPDGEGFFFQDIQKNKTNYLKKENSIYFEKEGKRVCYLAHKRLSIVDLDIKAAQPMISICENFVLTFNGEIYNHHELRNELVDKGHSFNTNHSDTEVVLNSFIEWGEKFVHKLRGMFAIALYNRKEDILYLIRDRIGIKPLYYTKSNDNFYFASEIKAIIKDKSIKKELNKKGLYDFLSFLTVPAPYTLFKDIFKIPAGHMLKIEKGVPTDLIEYWDVFDEVINLDKKTEDEIKKELINELQESVSLRMGADVPVGVFLSGGVDSSINASLFSKLRKSPVSSFSVGYENDDKLSSYKNEFVYARLIAKSLNSDYHENSLTQQMLLDFIPDLIHFQDEPIADPVCFPVYEVSKLAKSHNVTVCQVGEGSDELFWGYKRWKVYYYLDQVNSIPFLGILKKIVFFLLSKTKYRSSMSFELLRRAVDNEPIFWSGAEAFTEQQKRKLLSKQFLDEIGDYSSYSIIKEYRKKFEAKSKDPSFVNWMAYADLKLRLPELLLMRVDKMSMAVSLEARVPFLDHKFVSFAMSIPSKLKTKKGISKYILKKAFEGILPNEIIYRKKQGFGAPVHDWFLDKLGENAKKSIKETNNKTNYFDNEYLNNLFETNQGVQAWYLYNYSEWLKKNIN